MEPRLILSKYSEFLVATVAPTRASVTVRRPVLVMPQVESATVTPLVRWANISCERFSVAVRAVNGCNRSNASPVGPID